MLRFLRITKKAHPTVPRISDRAVYYRVSSSYTLQYVTLEAPLERFQGHAAELAQVRGIQHLHVSISDEHDFALAFVVLSKA